MRRQQQQWPQALLAPWAWHAQPGRANRWRDAAGTAAARLVNSRAAVASVVLTVVLTAGGVVGWTSGAFFSASGNGANSWSADTLLPPSGFTVTQTCTTSNVETITFRGAFSNTGEGAIGLVPPSGRASTGPAGR